MINAIRKRLDQREEGFTLIELLVVVIIIGILAAIAIPTFLSQRERGWQAELTSTLRNVALEAEASATATGGSYVGIDATDLQAFATAIQGAATPVTIGATVVATASRLCFTATHSSLTTPVSNQAYDTAAGGVQPFNEAGSAVCA